MSENPDNGYLKVRLEDHKSSTKIQTSRVNTVAVKGKNPEKSEIGYPDIRIVENTMAPLVSTHAKY